jgi:hypothetical protein
MALDHYDYFKGSMRNFGVFDGQLTATEMDDIVKNLKLHDETTKTAGTSTSSSSSTSGSSATDDDEYWHICRNKFNESALSGNSSMTLAERMTASGCTSSSCVANTTECEEHSNSLKPIWHANPAGAELTCEIRQIKMEMRFGANASASLSELTACFTAGTCSGADLPSIADLIALPGMAATGFNFTTDVLKNLGKAVEYTLKHAMNDDDGCTPAVATALLDEDPTDTVAETKTVTSSSKACPKYFKGRNDGANTYSDVDKFVTFTSLMNTTTAGDYGLTISQFGVPSDEDDAHLTATEQVSQLANSNLATAINATTGEITIGINSKVEFKLKGVTDNVAAVIGEAVEDTYYSDLIPSFLYHMKKQYDTTRPTGMVAFPGGDYLRNVNMTLASGGCTMVDSYGQSLKFDGSDVGNGPNPSNSGSTSQSASSSNSDQSDSPVDDGTGVVAAKKKKSSNAFRSTGVSMFASVAVLLSALLLSRH